MRRGAAASLLAIVFLAPALARAAPRIEAQPIFPELKMLEHGLIQVTLEGDATPHRLDVASMQESTRWSSGPATRATVEVELPAHARKSIVLPFAARAYGDEATIEIVASEDGRELARTVAKTKRRDLQVPSGIVLGTMPPSLGARLRASGLAPIPEIDPAILPDYHLAWPRFEAIVWPAPRRAELSPAQATALRAWILRGGQLIVGITPEEPHALEELGFGDLLPADVRPGDGLDLALEPRVGATSNGSAAASAHRGFGVVTLVAADLGRTLPAGVDPWSVLDKPPASGQRRGWSWGMDRHAAWALQASVQPRAPVLAAAVLLGLFALAAVPLDGLLTRSATRLGRRSRWGAWRYPATVALATAAGFLLMQHATGTGAGHRRLDVVDVDLATGSARAMTLVAHSRGEAGSVQFDVQGDAHVGALMSIGGDEGAVLVARVAQPGRCARVIAPSDSWEPVALRAAWTPEPGSWPHVEWKDGSVVVPQCLAAARGRAGAIQAAAKGRVDAGPLVTKRRAPSRLPDLEDLGQDDVDLPEALLGLASQLTSRSLREESVPMDLRWPEGREVVILVTEGLAGPPVLADGVPLDDGATIWRFLSPETSP